MFMGELTNQIRLPMHVPLCSDRDLLVSLFRVCAWKIVRVWETYSCGSMVHISQLDPYCTGEMGSSI